MRAVQLELKDVTAGYGKIQVLNGVQLAIEKGDFVALIGPNGAGKSTVLKTIFGLVDFRQGHVRFEGHDLKRLKSHEVVNKGIAYIHQGRNVFPTMTVEENLQMGAYIAADKKRVIENMERVYGMFPILRQKRKDLARSLSGGQQQMVAMGRAIMIEPKMIVLDEPSIGLAPNVVEQIFEKIGEINRQGITVLMVEQNVQEALRHARKIHILRQGKIEFSGTPQQVIKSEVLRKAYLG